MEHLNETQRRELERLIEKNSQVFSSRPGKCTLGAHKIVLKDGAEPRAGHAYKVPMAYRKEVERQVDELLEWGRIYPVESPHAHPVVCVAKKDGGLRLGCDYRRLNAITEQDAFPMSLPSELFRVAKANYISLIDMLRGYWQIPLDKQAQALTAFVTPVGQYAWKVMPFGLRNARSTFQRVISQVLAPHREYACVYIDDLAIYSDTWEEHLSHVQAVLASNSAAGFTVNAGKCRFARREVEFLGHVVGSGRHSANPEKVRAIDEMPRPQTKEQFRTFFA